MLSRQVKTGHEQPFEAVLRRLAAVVRCQPRHLDATMLKPCPGGPPSCTIVSYPARRHDADAWPSSKVQARLGVEAEVHSPDAPQTQHLSGLEGRLAAPGHPGAGPARAVEDHAGLRGRDRAAAGSGRLLRCPAAIAACRGGRRWSSS